VLASGSAVVTGGGRYSPRTALAKAAAVLAPEVASDDHRKPRAVPTEPAQLHPAAALLRHEHDALDDLLKGLRRSDPIFDAVSRLVFADGEEARLAAVGGANPELVSDRGDAALGLVVSFATSAGFVTMLPKLQEVQAWLRERWNLPAAPTPEPPFEPAAGPHELVAGFIAAAINADQTFRAN
jgi:hypothetical protein